MFKVVCGECGKETTITNEPGNKCLWIMENNGIKVECNWDGAWEEIKCDCGNEIKLP